VPLNFATIFINKFLHIFLAFERPDNPHFFLLRFFYLYIYNYIHSPRFVNSQKSPTPHDINNYSLFDHRKAASRFYIEIGTSSQTLNKKRSCGFQKRFRMFMRLLYTLRS
jgi:hypothetical protein